ncbi:MAG: 7-carboxy-7-deazaguanine synthase QueE, partial [Cytophagales bacterium]|nr:7-carboxy-7-deazaguanine synthase QueE [Cytophagales bacterium]
VKESWDLTAHPQQLVDTMVKNASKHPARIAVITGGEPLMHNLDFLCSELKNEGFRTHIETSGAHPLSGKWDWICLSPKKFKEPLREICSKADELKMIIFNSSDFSFAEQYKSVVSPSCKLFLQPEWNKSSEMLPQIIEYVKQHPEWQISLQTHKYMDIP